MTIKTIPELPDGEDTRTNTSVVAFSEGGTTFKGTIRPNPLNVHYVNDESQLFAKLGPDLIIPVDTPVTIVIDRDMNLTKPFRQQDGSSLLLMSESSNVELLVLDQLIVMDAPGDIGHRVEIDNLTIIGTPTKTCLEIEEDEFFTIHQVFFAGFAKLGFVKGANIVCRELGIVEVGGGFDFIDNPFADLIGLNGNSSLFPFPITIFNFITTGQIDVVIQRALFVNPNEPDSFVFFDPNSGPGSSFTIRDCGITTPVLLQLFQKGANIPATASAAGAAPNTTQFDITAHNLQVGQYTVLKTFTGELAYNGTFKVTANNGVNSVDIAVPFTSVDATGMMNAASLDATEPRVEAFSNPDQPDSMFIGDAGLELAAPITVVITSQDLAVPITNANWAYNNLERFDEDLVTIDEGRLISKDFSERRYSVTYSATINRSGGGGVNIGIVLIKNGVLATPISFNPPRVFTTSVTFLTRTEIVSLEENDVLQIAVINYDGTADIDVYQSNLSVNRG